MAAMQLDLRGREIWILGLSGNFDLRVLFCEEDSAIHEIERKKLEGECTHEVAGMMGGFECLNNPQLILANHLCCLTSLAPL